MNKNLRTFESARARRSYIEEELEVNLSHTGNYSFDEQQAVAKNIENMIGATQIPLGIAGPISLHGAVVEGDHYIPLATTEGALVASINRGCKAVSESGGVQVYANNEGMTRGPVFYTGSLKKSKYLSHWITENETLLRETAETTSSHLKLKKIIIKLLADTVFIRFSFITGDAMGMNMVTVASEKMVRLIEKETETTCLAVAGNYDIDKKPAWLNFINNRGYTVWGEVCLKRKIVEEILKTTPEKLFDVWLSKCIFGSIMSGSLGFNAQYANIVAALFIATGQDPAHVVEGSMGITSLKVLPNGDLYVSVYLPAVILGILGGGTSLPTQREALSILHLNGDNQPQQFAEIIAGVVLAGEISLLSSLAEGSLGKAHIELGRGK